MRSRHLVKTLVVLVAAALALPFVAAAQTQTSGWTVPRTPWGDPDIQGLWPANDMQGTPYERPESMGTRATLNDEEFAARQQTRERQAKADGEVYVPQGQRTGIGGPSHWSAGERGNPQRQASLVVDPPNGRIPAMTEEGKKRIALARSTCYYDFPDAVVAHPFEKFDDLGPYDRWSSRRRTSTARSASLATGTPC